MYVCIDHRNFTGSACNDDIVIYCGSFMNILYILTEQCPIIYMFNYIKKN
jgi:hypothetical protein